MPRRRAARALSVVLTAAVLALVTAAPAGAADPCAGVPGVDDTCESWTAVYDNPAKAPGSYQLEPRVAASADGSRLFVSVIDEHHNADDPYNSPASWAVLGYDGATGEQRWLQSYQGPGGYDRPNAIAASPDGSLVVATGGSYSAPLLQPGAERDLMTIAYDGATGRQLWRTQSTGLVHDVGTQVLLGRDGSEVYVVVNNLLDGGDIDWAVVAYDARDGRQLWRTPYAGVGLGKTDSPKSAALSPAGDLLYVTGESGGTADYDADYATVAYALRGPDAGQQIWEQRYDGVEQDLSDRAREVAVDVDGRVIVTGDSLRSNGLNNVNMEYATVAYDGTTGRQLWASRYAGTQGGGLHFGTTLATSPSNRVAVVSGQSDAGGRDYDWATIAYDTETGAERWVQRLSTPQIQLEFATDTVISPDGTTAVLAGISGANNPTGYRDLNRSPGLTVGYRLSDGALQWSARHYGNDDTDSFSPRQLVMGRDGSAYTVGQLTNNLQTDESDNVYDAMLVGYRAVTGPAPVVPEGKPWLIGLIALAALGLAARRCHSFG
ncbi:MAG: PQQ-binding-like beta-propeller repeat protein [Frankiaceae bacterium]|nr:PQQ-binding-like beta-propeller repeat protein [Frankiaceae bacterium]